MKSNNPITARVQAKFKNLTVPVNQEVTLNADGTGGPIIAPGGHVINTPEKDCGCGCGGEPKSLAKFDPLTMMVVSKVAKKIL